MRRILSIKNDFIEELIEEVLVNNRKAMLTDKVDRIPHKVLEYQYF